MASTYSDLLGYEKQATGEHSATWGDVLNTTLELLEDSIAGSLSKSVAGSSDVTLTDLDGAIDEHRKMVMEFTGVLTGNINVIVPATSKLYFIHNNTSGAFTLTVKPSAGTGIAVTQGSKDILIADGTNVVRAIDVSSYTHPNHSGDVTSSGDGATTIVNDAVTADKLANSVNTDIATGVTASTTAGDALPKAGGTMTGALTPSSINWSAARVRRNAVQAITNSTWTLVVFQETSYDTLSEFTATGRFVATAAGKYHVQAKIEIANASWTQGKSLYVHIYKNGVSYCSGYQQEQVATNLEQKMGLVTDTIELVATDYLEIYCLQNQGTTLNLTSGGNTSDFSVSRIS